MGRRRQRSSSRQPPVRAKSAPKKEPRAKSERRKKTDEEARERLRRGIIHERATQGTGQTTTLERKQRSKSVSEARTRMAKEKSKAKTHVTRKALGQAYHKTKLIGKVDKQLEDPLKKQRKARAADVAFGQASAAAIAQEKAQREAAQLAADVAADQAAQAMEIDAEKDQPSISHNVPTGFSTDATTGMHPERFARLQANMYRMRGLAQLANGPAGDMASLQSSVLPGTRMDPMTGELTDAGLPPSGLLVTNPSVLAGHRGGKRHAFNKWEIDPSTDLPFAVRG